MVPLAANLEVGSHVNAMGSGQPSDFSRSRDSSLSRLPTAAKKRVTKSVLDEINAATKRKKSGKSFVCYDDLKRIWSVHSRISTLLQPDLSQGQIDCIQSCMIMILSTLVFVGATDCLENFRARLFDRDSGAPLLTDEAIPFDAEQLVFLDPGSAARQHFYTSQFKFKPVFIELTRNQKTQVIENKKMRLPFESCERNVGSGGFGDVDRVTIPPKYIRGEEGLTWETPQVVACKRIKVLKHFIKELDNLQILKESLTRHDRILLHLSTIKHGTNHYILLPYAEYGDLEVFLLCGKDYLGEEKYDFDTRFGSIGPQPAGPLLRQCSHLANALCWLHNDIKIEGSSNRVFCTHMDLKPANILIQPDPNSPVGKWVISDFGISVLKESPQQESGFASIRDYVSQATMNTRPKRVAGTYQAPEVHLTDDASGNYSPDQRGVGRKSDIWSLGCILSELLAFALGKDHFVRNFNTARKGSGTKNFFYVEEANPRHLSPGNAPKQYQVNPSVIIWLDEQCRTPRPYRWVECYVETIKSILIVDTIKRPDAIELERLINHVEQHVTAFERGEKINCSLLQVKDGKSVVSSRGGSYSSESRVGDHTVGQNSNPASVVLTPSLTPRTSSAGDSSRSQTNTTPLNTHGIIVGSAVQRKAEKPKCVKLERPEWSNDKATAVAMGYLNGRVHAAYLVKSSVYFYNIDHKEISAAPGKEVKLPQLDGWEGIAVAGHFMGAWGYNKQRISRMLHLCDTRGSDRQLNLPSNLDIKNVLRVAVSPQGAAALLSSRHISVVKIDDETSNPPLSAQPGQVFTDVAFNTTGDLLFAWAFGRNDSLYVWHCANGVVGSDPDFETHYTKDGNLEPNLTRLFPYNTHLGSIIMAHDRRFFITPRLHPAPHRRTSSTSSTYYPTPNSSPNTTTTTHRSPQPRTHVSQLSDAKAAVLFADHSLITAERKRRGATYLKEYKIESDGVASSTHHLQHQGAEICKLAGGGGVLDDASRIMVVEDGDDVVVVIVCYLNAVVEFVKVVRA